MFTLEARSARIELSDRQQMRAVVRRLRDAGYRALVERMVWAAEQAAGLDDGSLDTDWLAPQPPSPLRRMLPEILFHSDALFVLAPAGKRLDAWEVRPRQRSSLLDDFCDAVATAVAAEQDDETDAPQIEWRPHTLPLPTPGADLGHEIEQTSIVSPEVDRAAAEALADDDARSFVTDLVRSGSSITDLDDTPMSQYRSISELYRQGLIEREHLIICRQDHRTLGRISELDDEARHSILQLACPTCGRRFDEELVRQVYAPSRAAAAMVIDGRWRANWAQSLLAGLGLDTHTIRQMGGSGGNGTALRVDALHGRLLIELPDAEFGMQHAYALVRRLRRQGIAFGLVLATEPVADEAHQYLRERVALQQGPTVSVLEGSRSIGDDLGRAIDEWSIISVRMLAEELIDTTGIDLGAVIEAWMRQDTATDVTDEIILPDEGGTDGDGATVTELSSVSYGQ